MKITRFILLTVICMFTAVTVEAQEKFSLQKISIGYGESPVASGVDIGLGLTKQSDAAIARFGSES